MFGNKIQLGKKSLNREKRFLMLITLLTISFLFGSALVIMVIPNASSSDGEKTIIYGNVKDKDTGEAIIEAKISIYEKEQNHTYKTFTDEDGNYDQEVDNGGNYSIVAEKESYNTEDKHEYVKKDEHKQVDFELGKKENDKTVLKGYTKEKDSGEQISHVTIKISKDNFSKDTESDEEGYYEFELDSGGEYDIRAEKDGYNNYESEVYIEEGKENEHNILMEKESSGDDTKIYGYVKDKNSGDAIVEAEIHIYQKDNGKNYSAYTNGDGHYSKIVEDEGNYSVKAKKDGYKTQEKHAYVENGKHTRVDFELEKEGGEETVLKGYTKEKDSGEHISNVNIRISKGNFSKDTKSDENGYYKFDLEEGGKYILKAEKDGFNNYEEEVYLENGEENQHHIRMEKEGGTDETWIFGHVRDKASEEEIIEAKITIKLNEDHTYTAYSDEKGYYEKQLEHGGNYSIIAEKEGYKELNDVVYIKDGEENQVDLNLEKEGGDKTKIFGHVKDIDTEEAINEVKIILSSLDCNCTYDTYSDTEGYYIIEIEQGGNFSIKTKREGYKEINDELFIEDGDEKELNIHLEKEEVKETWVKGYIKDKETEEPLNEVEVNIIYDDNHSYAVYSDVEGRYKKQLEHGGDYKLIAEKEGYNSEDASVFIEKGEEKQVNFLLEKEDSQETWIFGHVKNKANNEPIIEAEININHGDLESYTVYSNENGYYQQKVDGDRNYSIIAEKENYNTEDYTLFVEKEQENKFDILLAKKEIRETIIYGYVFDNNHDNPMNNAIIHLIRGENTIKVTSNEKGYYLIKLEEGGKCVIEVEKDGYKNYRSEFYLNNEEHKSINITLEIEEIKEYGLDLECNENNKIIEYGENAIYEITVKNTGSNRDLIKLGISEIPKGWNTELEKDSVELNPGESIITKLVVISPNNVNFSKIAEINVIGTSHHDNEKSDKIGIITTIKSQVEEKFVWIFKIETDKESYENGNEIKCTVTVQRGNDLLDVVYEGVLNLKIIDGNNEIVYETSKNVVIASAGSSESITFDLTIEKNGTYTIKGELSVFETVDNQEITIKIGKENGEESFIPGFDSIAVATAISMGALVACFRRRD